ncbi:MAG: hypothetical protein JF601_02340 [Acidobacteria bacterium]|nr:hypothetical protein [Acidobacteriota bacterium]
MRVAAHEIAKYRPLRELPAEVGDAHHLGAGAGVRHLNQRVPRCDRIGGENRFDAEHAFVANGRRFHHRPVGQHGRDRRHAAVQEIDQRHRLAVLVQHLLVANGYRAQVRLELAEVVERKPGEQLILRAWRGRRRDRGLPARFGPRTFSYHR